MKLKEDIKRTAKTISLQELNESEIGKQIEYEIERLIKAKRTNKKIDYDKIKNAITLELKQLKRIRMRYNESKEINSRNR